MDSDMKYCGRTWHVGAVEHVCGNDEGHTDAHVCAACDVTYNEQQQKTCPNCLQPLNSPVTTGLVHVLCNGRGEHITSALPMDREERAELLEVMDRTNEGEAMGAYRQPKGRQTTDNPDPSWAETTKSATQTTDSAPWETHIEQSWFGPVWSRPRDQMAYLVHYLSEFPIGQRVRDLGPEQNANNKGFGTGRVVAHRPYITTGATGEEVVGMWFDVQRDVVTNYEHNICRVIPQRLECIEEEDPS